jgi:ABC-2 type transport system ATP-binding protein
MGASRFVGRVGGLAVALGVGAAIVAGGATASADTGDTSTKSTSSDESSSDPGSIGEPKQRNDIKIKSTDGNDQSPLSPGSEGNSKTSRTSSFDRDPGERTSENTEPEDDDDAVEPAETHPAKDKTEKDEPADEDPAEDEQDGGGTSEASETPSRLDRIEPTEVSADSVPVTGAVTYNPTVTLDDGVITGANSGLLQPYTYTVVRGPSSGGKVALNSDTGNFTFLPYLSSSTPAGTERFSVLVAEQTAFTQALGTIPIVEELAPRVLVILQQVPIVKDVLSPLIGRSEVFGVDVDVDAYLSQGPIAFTTKIVSFDGTRISVNYFPASGLGVGEKAPTILNGPSLATAGYTDLSQPSTVSGLVPGISLIREQGYNVVTWDPRGEFASGGRMQLDSEDFEARDVSAIISWVGGQAGTAFEASTDDPLIGMLGGSYGGGIQLTSAGIDPRIDAIAPGIAWNSLETALYPNNAFKTAWASLLALSLAVTGSRPDLEIYAGIATGVLSGFLTPGQRDFLSRNSPDTVVDQITAPTLFLQGTVDGLFVLQQAIDNAEQLQNEMPVRMIWYCGGHGYCLDLDEDQEAAQTSYLIAQQFAWMDTYVKNKGEQPAATGPAFVWVDQRGDWYSADTLPTEGSPFFSGTTITAAGGGGLLPVVPILGGSGPQNQAPFPLNLPAAAESQHALDVAIPARPPGSADVHVVGPPQLTLTYSGLGTSRNIYAQLVDNETHRVLGNLVTPVPVVLDGRTHTVTIDMENIAYTMGDGDSLTLQIVDSATAYEDFSSFGLVNVSAVQIVLPTANSATPVALPAMQSTTGGPAGTPSLEDVLTGGRRA